VGDDQPGGEREQGGGHQGQRAGLRARRQTGQPGHGQGCDDDVDHGQAPAGSGLGHPAEQRGDRLAEDGLGGEPHRAQPHCGGSDEGEEHAEGELEGHALWQEQATGALVDADGERQTQRQAEHDGEAELADHEPPGAVAAPAAQAGQGHLGAALLDGRGRHREQHDRREQAELGHQQGDDEAHLLLAVADAAQQRRHRAVHLDRPGVGSSLGDGRGGSRDVVEGDQLPVQRVLHRQSGLTPRAGEGVGRGDP
jgi:hypothetical protein